MTRKRFIKLLMAEGMPRNQARCKARIARRFGSYEDDHIVSHANPILMKSMFGIPGGVLKIVLEGFEREFLGFAKAAESSYELRRGLERGGEYEH